MTLSSQARYAASMMKTVQNPLAVLVRGEGCYVWDDEGTRYLDFLAGIAVNSLGHAHPVFVEAVSSQAALLAHVSNYFASPPQIELAERLKRLTGAGEQGRVYFANSGAEANEAAFKLARRNTEVEVGAPARSRILALHNAFHGRTMGAMAMTGKPAMRAPFEPMPSGVEHIEASFEALERSIDETVAALIVEPVQGEAGVVPLPDGFLARARELTSRFGALLIVDEIQTGVGRTGAWFAYQHDGVVPDAVTVAKGIAGGFPIGALVTFGAASDLFTKGQHGSTFGGNPLGTATANAVLGEIESAGLVENARLRGDQIRALIAGLDSDLVAEVRGSGLLIGIGLHEPVAGRVVAAAQARGLIINAANDSSIRIAPPLIVGDAEIAEFGELLGLALRDVAESAPA